MQIKPQHTTATFKMDHVCLFFFTHTYPILAPFREGSPIPTTSSWYAPWMIIAVQSGRNTGSPGRVHYQMSPTKHIGRRSMDTGLGQNFGLSRNDRGNGRLLVGFISCQILVFLAVLVVAFVVANLMTFIANIQSFYATGRVRITRRQYVMLL